MRAIACLLVLAALPTFASAAEAPPAHALTRDDAESWLEGFFPKPSPKATSRARRSSS